MRRFRFTVVRDGAKATLEFTAQNAEQATILLGKYAPGCPVLAGEEVVL